MSRPQPFMEGSVSNTHKIGMVDRRPQAAEAWRPLRFRDVRRWVKSILISEPEDVFEAMEQSGRRLAAGRLRLAEIRAAALTATGSKRCDLAWQLLAGDTR